MRAVDDERAAADSGRAAIDVVARQSPVACALFLYAGGSGVRAGLVVVVDDAAEGLVGVGTAHYPCAAALGLHVEARQNGAGIARQAAEIVGRLVLGAVDGRSRHQVDGGVLDAHAVADGKLAVAAVVAGAGDDELSGEVVPVALDVFTQIADAPLQGSRSADGALVVVPAVEVEG